MRPDHRGRKGSAFRRRLLLTVLLLPLLLLGVVLMTWSKDDWLLALLPGRYPEVVFFFPTDLPLVGLTIDDAPDPITTTPILDLLAEHDAKATFFIIADRIPGNEALLERMVAEGHELGNHMTADEMSIRLAPEEFERKLHRAHERLSPFASVHWFRPASGWFNKRMVAAVRELDYRMVLGSIFPFDTHHGWSGFSSWLIRTRSGPGSVIVLHDGGEQGINTHEALTEILPSLREQGLQTLTLSEIAAAMTNSTTGGVSR